MNYCRCGRMNELPFRLAFPPERHRVTKHKPRGVAWLGFFRVLRGCNTREMPAPSNILAADRLLEDIPPSSINRRRLNVPPAERNSMGRIFFGSKLFKLNHFIEISSGGILNGMFQRFHGMDARRIGLLTIFVKLQRMWTLDEWSVKSTGNGRFIVFPAKGARRCDWLKFIQWFGCHWLIWSLNLWLHLKSLLVHLS